MLPAAHLPSLKPNFQFPKRISSVAVLAFCWLAEFGEGLVVAFGLEEGIVAEAIFAAWFFNDLAFADAVENFRFAVLSRAGARDHAAEACGAVVFFLAGKFV